MVDFLVRKNPNAARRARQTLAEGFASLAEFADRGDKDPVLTCVNFQSASAARPM
uniref:Uncharacterized protein n=1 Tax=Phenylobacterium glaciei TaxID=2803784 RepID=A0A974P2E7_9CAUL|nr:hypothetical protein JKL49_21060 [Phenylobacterium glaciei]